MRKKFRNKSIYTKFILIFIGIWWLLNTLTYSMIIHVIASSSIIDILKAEMQSASHQQLLEEMKRIRILTGQAFFISTMTGTILIILAVRGIVRPIKRLSNASKEVAQGNFDIEVKVKSMDEIGQLTTDFNLMTKELKNIDILRKDFVSNVSHEYKTPITSIMGYAKLIKEDRCSEEQLKEYSEIIINESERLSLLSSNLLKISELDSKVIREQSTAYSLDEQIRKAILLLEVQWSKKNLEFDIDLEELTIVGDKNLLQQVWLNLIQNAIKFSNQEGLITIQLFQQDENAVFQVTDQGIGIAEEDKSRVFERFFKGDKSRSKEGNGLGLVLVKMIVELSNGKVHFDSKQGEGSTFVVELPLQAV
ncbi:MAG TPA: HAMP domain-containing sensor histidine kinase [Mobilitalea sp.]|nr:HAMP domain-containing sensor histidine kinase [Mobilitalea sp.]